MLSIVALTFFGFSCLNSILGVHQQASPLHARAHDSALHFSWAAFLNAAAAAAFWRLFKRWESLAAKTQHLVAAGVTLVYVCNYAWLVYSVTSFEDAEWAEFPHNRGGEQAL